MPISEDDLESDPMIISEVSPAPAVSSSYNEDSDEGPPLSTRRDEVVGVRKSTRNSHPLI